MATPLRPSLLDRAMSTPPITPNSISNENLETPPKQPGTSVLTPPTSPRQSRSSSKAYNLANSREVVYPRPLASLLTDGDQRVESNIPEPETQPVIEIPVPECPFDVEILKDDRGRDAIFGTGAWSIVFKGTAHAKPESASGSYTPPLSPILSAPLLVAVKKPTRRDAPEILKSEARILSYLHTVSHCEKYVVPFFGTIDGATLILEAIPFSFEDLIRSSAIAASENMSTWNMHEPVMGSVSKWLHVARQLISGLAWLHDQAGVVHGDIKPANILLSQMQGSGGADMTFEPVFADFSSAQLLIVEETTPNTLSAVTREYTAPEILSSKVLRDPNSTATTASDVFSLAVTLLVAATGQLLVYPGSVFQRQLMATQGWMILSHVRNGDQGARVPRLGVVERVLERAVLKADMGRVSAPAWLEFVTIVSQGEEPVKKS